MRARKHIERLTLLDIIATVSRFARNERETAAVVNHLLSSSKISFVNSPAHLGLQGFQTVS